MLPATSAATPAPTTTTSAATLAPTKTTSSAAAGTLATVAGIVIAILVTVSAILIVCWVRRLSGGGGGAARRPQRGQKNLELAEVPGGGKGPASSECSLLKHATSISRAALKEEFESLNSRDRAKNVIYKPKSDGQKPNNFRLNRYCSFIVTSSQCIHGLKLSIYCYLPAMAQFCRMIVVESGFSMVTTAAAAAAARTM